MVKDQTKKSTTKPKTKKIVDEEEVAEEVVETQKSEQPRKKKTSKKKEQPKVVEEEVKETQAEEMEVEEEVEEEPIANDLSDDEEEIEDESEEEMEEVVEEPQPSPKKKKRSRKSKEVESEEVEEEEEPKQDVETARIEKARSLGEIKTSEELKALTAEYYKKYHGSCKGFIDYYNKNFVPKKVLEPWEQADKLLTDAGVTKSKWIGLKGAELGGTQLVKAVPALKLAGEQKFEQAQEIIKTLSSEDLEKLWTVQIRNKDAKKFEDLVCKSDYKEKLLEDRIRAELAKE